MTVIDRLRVAATLPFRLIQRSLTTALTHAHKRPKITFVTLGSVGIVVLIVGGLFLYMHSARNHEEQARKDAQAAGERDVATLLSYDHNTVGKDIEDRKRLLTGHFQTDYTNLVRDVVVPNSQKQQLTTSTNVARSAVIRNEGPDQVWLMLFLNQTTKIGDKPDPVFNGSRVRVELNRVNGQWAISEITPV